MKRLWFNWKADNLELAFRRWKLIASCELNLMEGNRRKCSFLRYYLDIDGSFITNETEHPERIMEKLKEHCEGMTNVHQHRGEINGCKQGADELFITFLTRLKNKFRLCHFERDIYCKDKDCTKKILEKRLIDYFIAGFRDPFLR